MTNTSSTRNITEKFGAYRDFTSMMQCELVYGQERRKVKPDYPNWDIETISGVTHYSHLYTNAHYIVDGEQVHTVYGYHAYNLVRQLRRQNAERSIARKFWVEYRNRLIDELEAMRDLGISMNDPRYEHVYLINYDVCEIAWNDRNFTLPGLV